MTAVASQRPNMDLLQVEDQMDLASTPAMPLEDVDFELDDIREISAEPNQDIMVQDEPEQQLVDSDFVHSSTGVHIDDDLMLDEDTITQQDIQADLPELNMDNHPDESGQVDEDDDILYEDEEGLEEDGGTLEDLTKEQEMIEIGAGLSGTNQEFQNAKDELQATADVGEHANQEFRGAEETNNDLGEQQVALAGTAVGVNYDGNVSMRPGSDDVVDRQPGLKFLEHNLNDDSKIEVNIDLYDESATNEQNQAELGANPNNMLALEEDTISSNESSAQASENLPQHAAHNSESHVYPDMNSALKKDIAGSTVPGSLLHTVMVNYLGTEMCLFPPTEDDDSEMFFLEDQSLAYQSLNKMLAACRDVLANTIGLDDELVLDVASLGLHISEGSIYATQLTLSQIIDVYIALAHNENVTDIEPLSCSLSSRVCLASQYAYLHSAARDGRTMTQILSENTFASVEGEEDGENERDELEYQPAESHCEEVPAEPKGTNGVALENHEDGDPLKPQPEATHVSANTRTSSPARAISHEPQIGLSGGDQDEIKINKKAESRDSVLQDKEQGSNSTVKGDSGENQDTTISVFDNQLNEDSTEDLHHSDGQALRDSSLVESKSGMAQNDMEESDIGSDQQDSVSSGTLEAENNHFEEDMFSQEGHTSANDNSNLLANHADDGEDFGLEEQNLEAAGFRMDGTQGGHLETGTESGSGQMTRAPNLGQEGNVELPREKREDNQEDIHAEADDEFLKFGEEPEENEIKEGKREPSSSAYQSIAPEHESVQSGNALNGFTDSHNATSANYNNSYRTEDESSWKALEHDRNQSPPRQTPDNTITKAPGDAPTTPSGGKNGSKRKTLEDEDEFDLFDTATPDKKRRRPS